MVVLIRTARSDENNETTNQSDSHKGYLRAREATTMSAATTQRTINDIAGEIYEVLEDHDFYTTAEFDYESEWTRQAPSGNYSTIEVVVNRSNIELYRGEFTKDDKQQGAKDVVVLTTGVTPDAMSLIQRRSA